MSFSRDLRALLIAVPVTSLVSSSSFALIGTALSWESFSAGDLGDLAKVIGGYSLVMLPFVALAAVFVATPIAALLRRLRLTGPAVLLPVGAVAGALVSMFVFDSFAIERSSFELAYAAAVGVMPGLVAAVIWWRLAETPDRDQRSHA